MIAEQESQSLSKLLIASALASSIGSFLFGFDTAVIAGTTASLEQVFELSKSQLGWVVSSALFGALLGAAAVGKPCERFGRVKVLAALAVFYLVSALGCAGSDSTLELIIYRLVGGVAVGGASVVSPLYIAEVTPAKQRGVLVALSQLNIVAGILGALLSNYLVIEKLGAEPAAGAWRWMFGMEAIPAVLFILSVIFIPESPRWLVHRSRNDEARRTLDRLGNPKPDQEIQKIQASFNASESGRESIFQRRYAKPLILVCGLAIFNQMDGINAILYYVTDIFRTAGFAVNDAFKQSVIVGLVNLLFTILGMALIDRIGRKKLLLIGSVSFIASHLLAAYAFLNEAEGMLVVIAAAGIVGSHAYSQGAVIWVCINELLPNAVRASGSSTACFVLWGMAILVSTYFPVLMASLGGYVFLIFGATMVLQLVLVALYLPETKGRSLEQIEAGL